MAVWAYAYEVESNPLTSDAEFDSECLKVRPEMHTSYHGRDNRKIDAWWRKNFRPNTGSWINGHPDLKGIRKYYLLWKDQKSYHLAKQKWSYYKTYAKHRIERVCRRVREAHYYETYAESRKRRKR